jgi:hypothetical protein
VIAGSQGVRFNAAFTSKSPQFHRPEQQRRSHPFVSDRLHIETRNAPHASRAM